MILLASLTDFRPRSPSPTTENESARRMNDVSVACIKFIDAAVEAST